MLSKNGKSLIFGLIALIIVAVLVFFLSKGAAKPAEQSSVNSVVAEQQTNSSQPPSPDIEAPKAVEEIAAANTAEAAVSEENTSSLLAEPAALMIDVASAMKDRVIGNDNAPVTIIEYSSMTCPHCANFTTRQLPEVKKRLLETGKARLIFRDFPLDNSALKAAMMARCVPDDKYFGLVEVIFSNQDRWMTSKDPMEGLAQLGALAGMDGDLFKACTQNAELETAVLQGVKDAQSKYHIESTPTFIFNAGAETLGGEADADRFEAIVNKLTKEK